MFHLLGLLFFFFLIILVVGLSLLSNLIRAIFGIGRKMSKSNTYGAGTDNKHTSSRNEGRDAYDNPKEKKKIFDNDEGEYVEFEEIKNQD